MAPTVPANPHTPTTRAVSTTPTRRERRQGVETRSHAGGSRLDGQAPAATSVENETCRQRRSDERKLFRDRFPERLDVNGTDLVGNVLAEQASDIRDHRVKIDVVAAIEPLVAVTGLVR